MLSSLIWFFAKVFDLLPAQIQRAFGVGIGLIWFDALRIRRRVVIDNIGRAFPELNPRERVRLGREAMKSFGQTISEYSKLFVLQREAVDGLIEIHGQEFIDREREAGRGVLILTQHLGNGDLGLACLSLMGWPIHLISKVFTNATLNSLWFGARQRMGMRFISHEKSSFDILRALNAGGIVVFVLDQFMGPPIGCRSRFFGTETGTAMGLALLAIKTKRNVIPAYTYRMENGKHALCFERPIAPIEVDGTREGLQTGIEQLTQKYNDAIESAVRKHPTQWMWLHRRWKPFR